MSDMRLIVAGAGGRMGRTLIHAIAATDGVALAGAVEAAGLRRDRARCRRAGRASAPNGVMVEAEIEPLLGKRRRPARFHHPGGDRRLRRARGAQGARACHRHDRHVGREREADRGSRQARRDREVRQYEHGRQSACALVKRVAKTLDADFDIEILEMHHNKKIDAPSGTALMLGRAAAEGRGIALEQHSERGRDGETGARRRGDIGFASLRGGTVAGDHTVIFAGPAERLELDHKAEDRMIFARGALKAALWARGKKPGLYSMMDVLGLQDF